MLSVEWLSTNAKIEQLRLHIYSVNRRPHVMKMDNVPNQAPGLVMAHQPVIFCALLACDQCRR